MLAIASTLLGLTTAANLLATPVNGVFDSWRELMKQYRPWNHDQSFLLPPSPHDWLPEGHLAYFILDIVKVLDLGKIIRAIDAKDARGERPYSPYMMVALLLYAYCVGVFSSRRIERATYEDVAFRVIAGSQNPDHTSICEFRRVHLDALAGLFKQTVQLCQAAGLVKLGRVAIDGSKLEANASKHKAMSYERMQEQEKRLEQEIADLLDRAEQADRADDERFGVGQREEDLPAELRRREGRLEKIRAAMGTLEAQAARTRIATLEEQATRNEKSAETHPDATERKRAEARAKKRREQIEKLSNSSSDDDEGTSGGLTAQNLETHQTPATPEGLPHPKAQYNFTDPESRIQERGGAFLQGYNAQATVDEEAQVVVAQAVTNLQPDNSHLLPMIEQTRDNCGAMPEVALGDAGYWKPENVTDAEELGVDPYLSVSRTKHGAGPPGDHTEDGNNDEKAKDAKAKMRAKLQTDEGRAHYARRKAIVEPVFGQIKECRGFRRFLLRGLRKVNAEWSLVTATHNLLKLFRHQTAGAPG